MAYMDFHPTIHKIGDEELIAAVVNENITEIEDAAIQRIESYQFSECKNLTKVHLHSAKTLAGNAFYNCNQLSDLYIPLVDWLGGAVFESCSSLKNLTIARKLDTVRDRLFANTSLEALILKSVKFSELSNISAFENTPISNGTGYIYVPRKMFDGSDGISAYESATNWSAFTGQFRYIEDYPEITGGR